MVEWTRKEIKNDPVLKQLLELIKKKHQVPNHSKKILLENKDVKDFCEEARVYFVLPATNPVYLHYDVQSWLKPPDQVQIKVVSIGVYEDEQEYELQRRRNLLSRGKDDADIPKELFN